MNTHISICIYGYDEVNVNVVWVANVNAIGLKEQRFDNSVRCGEEVPEERLDRWKNPRVSTDETINVPTNTVEYFKKKFLE